MKWDGDEKYWQRRRKAIRNQKGLAIKDTAVTCRGGHWAFPEQQRCTGEGGGRNRASWTKMQGRRIDEAYKVFKGGTESMPRVNVVMKKGDSRG